LSREVAVVPAIEGVHLFTGGGQRFKTGTEPGSDDVPLGEFVEVERGAALSVVLVLVLVLLVRHIIVGGAPVVDDFIDLLRFWLRPSHGNTLRLCGGGIQSRNVCLCAGISVHAGF
jgi:hypothetical protein